jgi:uncharacterized membrane-anchored protein
MAAAIEGQYGPQSARVWYDRAVAAPLDPVPGADGVFHFTTDGWQRLVREYGEHGRLSPPPLEEIQTALTSEQVKLLTAPPPAPLEEPTAETEMPADEEPAAETAAETAGGPDAVPDDAPVLMGDVPGPAEPEAVPEQEGAEAASVPSEDETPDNETARTEPSEPQTAIGGDQRLR